MGRYAELVAPSCSLFLLALLLTGLRKCTCNDWDQSLVLDDDRKYLVHWSLGNDETIEFMVEVETQGYVGFGLSMTGGMAGSDIVTGWIDNGIVSFQDRYGMGNFIPQIDDSQDWELLSGSRNDTHTVLTFRRQLNTCDNEQDVVIDENHVRMIYAYSEEVPKSPEDLQYHQWRRGIKGADLLKPPTEDIPAEKEIYVWDVLPSNFTLKSEIKSMYWCTIVKGPELHTKHHIIKYGLTSSPGGKSYTHHVILYECGDSDVSPKNYEKFAEQGGFPCMMNYEELITCWRSVAHWGVGIEEFSFLKHTGLPLQARPPKYYRLEVHYDNSAGVDNVPIQSGLRLWYTPELRKYDLSVTMIGADVGPLTVIPPAQNSYVIVGHAYSGCSAPSLPPGGVNITEVVLHAHMLAKRIILRHFRGNKELRPILQNDHYDFNYQQNKHLPEEITVLPGDQLVVECMYNSSMRTSPIFGGMTTRDEMCIAFLTYYPPTNMYMSTSVVTAPLLFGVAGLNGYMPNMTGHELRVKLETVDWNKVNVSLMQAATMYSPHTTQCRTESGVITDTKNLVTYPKNYEPYKEKDQCSQKRSKPGVSTGSHNGLSLASFVFSYALISYSCASEAR